VSKTETRNEKRVEQEIGSPWLPFLSYNIRGLSEEPPNVNTTHCTIHPTTKSCTSIPTTHWARNMPKGLYSPSEPDGTPPRFVTLSNAADTK